MSTRHRILGLAHTASAGKLRLCLCDRDLLVFPNGVFGYCKYWKLVNEFVLGSLQTNGQILRLFVMCLWCRKLDNSVFALVLSIENGIPVVGPKFRKQAQILGWSLVRCCSWWSQIQHAKNIVGALSLHFNWCLKFLLQVDTFDANLFGIQQLSLPFLPPFRTCLIVLQVLDVFGSLLNAMSCQNHLESHPETGSELHLKLYGVKYD